MHATAWAASSRLHARKVRWAAAMKLRIRLGRVLLLPKFVGFKFFQRQVLKKGGVVADYWSAFGYHETKASPNDLSTNFCMAMRGGIAATAGKIPTRTHLSWVC